MTYAYTQHLQHCPKYVPDDRHMASCLLFALKNIISRGYRGVFDIFWNFQGGEGGGGGTASSLKWKIRRGGGSYMKFPPRWGYGYFLELHNSKQFHVYPPSKHTAFSEKVVIKKKVYTTILRGMTGSAASMITNSMGGCMTKLFIIR